MNRRKINVYKLFRIIALGLLIILLLLVFIFSFIDFTKYVETVGYLRPSEYHIIRATTNGFIKNVYFEDCDKIEKGTLIIKLDTEEIELNLKSVSNQIIYLEKEIDRLIDYIELVGEKFKIDKEKEEYNINKSKILVETGGLTRFQYDKMIYEYEGFLLSYQISESELLSRLNSNESELNRLIKEKDKLKMILERSYIYSPAAGQLIDKSSLPLEGLFVNNGQEICLLYEDSDIIAEIMIPENQMGKVTTGQDVELNINAYPKEEYKLFKGKLTYISSDSNEGYYKAEASLNSDIVKLKVDEEFEGKRLLFGLGLKAKIKTGEGSIFDILFKNTNN